jgi:chromosome segregation ATPase
MISVEKLAAGLGPNLTQQLQDLSAPLEAAKARVVELEALLAQRRAELKQAQPVASLATADPSSLMHSRGLSGAVGDVLAALEKEIAAARLQVAQTGQPLHGLMQFVQNQRRRIAEIDGKLAEMEAERENITKELAA